MSEYLNINGGEYVHLSMVKRIRDVTPKERQSLATLGDHVVADKFNTRLDYANGEKRYASETTQELLQQGPAFVQTDLGVFVPRANIKTSRDLTENDRKDFAGKTGRPMDERFKAQLDTTAGRVLASVDSRTLMTRMAQPAPTRSTPQQEHTPVTSTPPQNHVVEHEAVKGGLAAQKDAAFAGANGHHPEKGQNREHPRER
ncbi:MAG: hypothetical protein AAF986_07975 [Pseudomonadota bacterium]